VAILFVAADFVGAACGNGAKFHVDRRRIFQAYIARN
jgi:hypothetical protein